MILDDKLIGDASAYADLIDADDDATVDMRSAVASFRHRLAGDSDRAAYAHGRAVVKLAERAGMTLPQSKSKPTKADLRKQVDDLGLDVPKTATVADLEQALAEHQG